MLQRFYTGFVLAYPKRILAFICGAVLLLASQGLKVSIDASSETLLLKNDKDLAFTREINQRYATSDFLVVTYKPKQGDLLNKETLEHIDSLITEVLALEMIDSVISILNVPLLRSSDEGLASLINDIPTLKSEGINKERVKQEMLSSAIYSNNLVSPDFKTTALQFFYKKDIVFFELLEQRNGLLKKEKEGVISAKETQELLAVQREFKTHRDRMREKNHQTIVDVRHIMDDYRPDSDLFLGGLNMIADDMITFIKFDLKNYGVAVLILLAIILYVVFRQMRYVLLPVFIALLSVGATAGILGVFGWEVTVISSNFISLQIIVTLSLVIHLSVRYRELLRLNKDSSHFDVVSEATLSMFKPCFYVILTTVAGFSSLMVSDIVPVINFSFMMALGIFVSFGIAFLVFPVAMILLPKIDPYTGFEKHFSFTKVLGRAVERNAILIYVFSGVAIVFSITGASRLIVENSFIDYFKSDTEIYKGMMAIDTSLGGTTPLDLIVNLSDSSNLDDFESSYREELGEDEFDDFSDFDEEFETETNDAQYWFTAEKMTQIEAIHDYLDELPETGKVLSFASMLKVGRSINEDNDLDNLQLALLYNKIPDEFKSMMLDPYLDIEKNQLRYTMRIIDSREGLRRNTLLEKIKTDLPKQINLEPESIRLAGMMLLYNNMLQSLFDSQIKSLALVVCILGAMFLILFSSIKVALVAMLANIIGVGVVFGLMGWANIPLDVMTITIAAISMGIAVDDTIHYLHRFKIEVANGYDYMTAMHRSHASIGYAMYYTTMAIIVGFSVLVLSNFLPTIYFGLLTVLAMFMALASNLLLLPRLIIWIRPFKEEGAKLS